jgi:hypothetical protein
MAHCEPGPYLDAAEIGGGLRDPPYRRRVEDRQREFPRFVPTVPVRSVGRHIDDITLTEPLVLLAACCESKASGPMETTTGGNPGMAGPTQPATARLTPVPR